ncbi:MAG TPA: nitrate ABC transporter permease [Verrucomicrobiae bacterium]|jgi:NitT/TauT family transport system permease protein|nr:nitrate ABC transporter permease [Verrucomicrobiae bacterium]
MSTKLQPATENAGGVGPAELAAPHASRKKGLSEVLGAFAPNHVVSRATVRIIIVFEIAVLLIVWATSTYPFLPKPPDVWRAFLDLWSHEGLGQELITSFMLNLQAMALATLISLGLAYLTVVPAFRPIVMAVSKGRFLGMVGLTFFFTLMFSSGHHLKVSLLVFGVSVFFVTSMIDVVAQIPKEKFDLARTLRMGEWRVVWEVIVLGRADAAFDAMRQNAAMGWMMLTMVEGISRSEGGIGALLLNQNKHFRLEAVFAIQIAILLIGLFQDYLLGLAKKFLFPYASLQLERQ